jgi:hypothetical protein
VVSFTHPGLFNPEEIFRGTYWIVNWVEIRVGLDAVAMRKSLSPAGNRTPFVQPLTILTELYDGGGVDSNRMAFI